MSTIRKAIITAAGRGTRQYPASKTVQKELFPLVDTDGYTKPTLQIIAQECIDSGIEEICIVTNPQNGGAIKAHFTNPTPSERVALGGKEWAIKLADELAAMAARVHIVVQEAQEGFGHAIYQAKDWAGSDPVLVLLGDHVYLANPGYENCSRQVLDSYARWDAPVSSVDVVTEDSVTRLGIIKGQELGNGAYKVLDLVEKPTIAQAQADLTTPGIESGKYLGHFEIHAFPNAIFEKLGYLIEHNLRRKDEFQLTSAQELLMRGSPTYIAQRVHGRRFDTGQPEELILTQLELAIASPYRSRILEALGR